MVAATVITFAALPVYWALFHGLNVVGLAIASDVGIMANTVALAALLGRRRLVPLKELNWKELGKAGATALVAGVLGYQVAGMVPLEGSRLADLKAFCLGTLTWAAAVAAGLWITRSELPRHLRQRRIAAAAAPAERPGENLTTGIEP
jgi:putative peptidoglycan lipid II flippase